MDASNRPNRGVWFSAGALATGLVIGCILWGCCVYTSYISGIPRKELQGDIPSYVGVSYDEALIMLHVELEGGRRRRMLANGEGRGYLEIEAGPHLIVVDEGRFYVDGQQYRDVKPGGIVWVRKGPWVRREDDVSDITVDEAMSGPD